MKFAPRNIKRKGNPLKNSTEYAKKFKIFCQKLPATTAEAHADGPVAEVIYSQMLWNATSKQADSAYRKLMRACIDWNDLRMNMPRETIELIGVSYPRADDRSRRLRAILRAIYLREHDVKLSSLSEAGKTEAKEYIQTLEGMSHFVAGRVLSLCFGVSAFPIDDRTFNALMNEGLLHDEADIEEAASWLGRQVKAKDVGKVHGSIHAWVEKKAVSKKNAPKKTIKKTVKKTAKKTVKKTVKKALAKTVKTKATSKKVVKKKTTKKKTAKK